jgi:hypothetical protein
LPRLSITSPLWHINSFANVYQKDQPLGWINIIHSSDIIAYPLRASLDINKSFG